MHWVVRTPEFEYIEPILDDGTGPIVIGHDAVCVDAPTKRKAIIGGVRKLRSKEWLRKYGYRSTYYGWTRDKNTNPYTGIRAEKAECEHGFCGCWGITCNKNEDYPYGCIKCWKESIASCNHEWNSSMGEENTCGKCGTARIDYDEFSLGS